MYKLRLILQYRDKECVFSFYFGKIPKNKLETYAIT